MGLELLFNESLELGSWINASSSNLTGSDFLSLFLVFFVLLLVALLLHMPEILVATFLLPVVITFAAADKGFWGIVGVLSIIVGMGLFSIFKR